MMTIKLKHELSSSVVAACVFEWVENSFGLWAKWSGPSQVTPVVGFFVRDRHQNRDEPICRTS